MKLFRLPSTRDRTAIFGRTGTGKTTLALWLLSHIDHTKRACLAIDYKGEKSFGALERGDVMREIRPGKKVPKRAGLYVMRPVPEMDDDAMRETLWHIWDDGNKLLYIDEGHLLPNSAALKAILVSGRSKRIQTISISQRPVWVPKEILSEADQHVVFALNDWDDRKTVGRLIPIAQNIVPTLPNHLSLWHDVGRGELFRLTPVPPPTILTDKICETAPRHARWF